MNMKRILWMNYFYAVMIIGGLILQRNNYEGIAQFFGPALYAVTIITTILWK